eukprot:Gregarina_sp_Pseudo_9__2514@NODE_2790_length_873_cov_29_504796_g2553_i0_p1_GENE_NODE_2790_length_873_cov_29_504796_g2553_i0NODE_2790_length_873_cov_29_504796_g2553_i0_p1_ORF_typecomplete_len260_score9_29_NODE_2790_length_873_cov_29_504796_g2553_i092817
MRGVQHRESVSSNARTESATTLALPLVVSVVAANPLTRFFDRLFPPPRAAQQAYQAPRYDRHSPPNSAGLENFLGRRFPTMAQAPPPQASRTPRDTGLLDIPNPEVFNNPNKSNRGSPKSRCPWIHNFRGNQRFRNGNVRPYVSSRGNNVNPSAYTVDPFAYTNKTRGRADPRWHNLMAPASSKIQRSATSVHPRAADKSHVVHRSQSDRPRGIMYAEKPDIYLTGPPRYRKTREGTWVQI